MGPAAAAREPTHFAALDLGTNNCRLLIATPTAHGFRIVDAYSRIVRLGEGLSQSGRLSGGRDGAGAGGRCASAPTSAALRAGAAAGDRHPGLPLGRERP